MNNTKSATATAAVKTFNREFNAVRKFDPADYPNNPTGFSKLCAYVNEAMYETYEKTPKGINWGYCFIWAYYVWALWPHESVKFATSTGHVMVCYNGRYYDSEHLNGVPSPFTVNGIQRNVTRLASVRWMCWYWASHGYADEELKKTVKASSPYVYRFIDRNPVYPAIHLLRGKYIAA